VRQALSNLISNALKFTEQGEVRVAVSSERDGVHVTVEDQGVGIEAKDLPHLFERFYQAKNTRKGTGIGLTIAKLWVEAHGGRIWAESAGPGRGSRFVFTLPA